MNEKIKDIFFTLLKFQLKANKDWEIITACFISAYEMNGEI